MARARGGESARRRQFNPRKNLWAYLALPVLLAAVVYIVTRQDPALVAIDADLCPVERELITQKTYILVDLSEALTAEQRAALQRTLIAAGDGLPARAQLSVSQLQTEQASPRVEVQRFCSPDLHPIGLAGERVQPEHCPAIVGGNYEWPRNVGDATRATIAETCNAYAALQEKVADAATLYAGVNVGQDSSFLIGGMEDIMSEANGEAEAEAESRAALETAAAPTRLIVFSDMLQNADWFSQYETAHGEWTVDNLRARRESAAAMQALGAPPQNPFERALLCYLPNDFLAAARDKNAHREMWADYFADSAQVKTAGGDACASAVTALTRTGG